MDIKAQRDQFMAFAFAAGDLLVECDANGRIVFAIGAGCGLGVAPQSIMGRSFRDLFDGPDRGLIDQLLAGVGPGRRAGPISARPAAENTTPASVVAYSLPGAEGRRFISIAYQGHVAPAAAAAERDDATGLVSTDDFQAVAEDTLEQLRKSGRDGTLTMLSLEGQDQFVQKLSDDKGDAFLGQLGAILRAASIGDAAAQVGDGRYSLIHEASLDPKKVEAELAAAAKAADPDGPGLAVSTSSVGVDPTLSPGDAARALVYSVKTFADDPAGGTDIADMGDALDALVRETGARISAFKSALADKKLNFVGQPIVDLKTKKVSHYELLVRFENGQSPFAMVTFAERTGLILDLDLAVFETACAYLSKAPTSFPGLAVNLSGLSISNPTFVSRLLRKLTAATFRRDALTFEITESAEIKDLKEADAVIQKLRKFGHSVCLDDFGAGAASFPYLRALDVDGVKIDGAYVREALETRRDALLLKAMASLCKDLGVTTIAEMIETKEIVQHLQKLGVEKGQGYLFGRPAPLGSLGQKAAA